MSCCIIGEAGLNHRGKVEYALKLADAARSCGADVVKFQTYNPDQLVHRNDTDFDLLSSLVLPPRDFGLLARHCQSIGIEFMSTPGDVDSLHFLVEELGVKRIKIGSDDLTNTKLLHSARYTLLPIILSTGMATMPEVWEAVHKLGGPNDVTLLHCVSSYPCRFEDANLKAITTLREAFSELGVPVGYSDHTVSQNSMIAATALGAEMLEAHIMLWDDQFVVDQAVSWTPGAFTAMINSVRVTETLLGHGRKEPCEAEMEQIVKLRKGADGRRVA